MPTTRKKKPAGRIGGNKPRGRLSRTAKIEKRLRGITKGVGANTKKAVHVVNVYAKHVPIEIHGYLVSQDDHNVVFRHKKSPASRKMRQSTFNTSDVIEVFGTPGEVSGLLIFNNKLISTVKGYVVRSKTSGVIKVKDNVTGEITTIYPNAGTLIEVYADEEEKSSSRSSGSGRGRSRKRTPKEEEYDEEEYDEDEEFED